MDWGSAGGGRPHHHHRRRRACFLGIARRARRVYGSSRRRCQGPQVRAAGSQPSARASGRRAAGLEPRLGRARSSSHPGSRHSVDSGGSRAGPPVWAWAAPLQGVQGLVYALHPCPCPGSHLSHSRLSQWGLFCGVPPVISLWHPLSQSVFVSGVPTPCNDQGLFLALHVGIIPGSAQGYS